MAQSLTIEGLAKHYGRQPALGPLDSEFAAGALTVVLGRSGCGKSTLLRCVAGLDAPCAGAVRFDNAAVRPDAVGFVFQEPRLMPWLTVARNVGFGLRRHTARERLAAVDAALDIVGLRDAAGLLPKQLSGGMAQRVSLARALATRPALLLLDEPFSALDPLTRQNMQEHLLAMHRRCRTTTVLITHDMEEALVLGQRVIVLRGPPGRIVGDFVPEPLLAHDRTGPLFQSWKRRLLAALEHAPPAVASPARQS